MKILIRNGRVLDPARRFDEVADVYIDGGVIAGVGVRPDGFVTGREIDAQGLVVAPGLVDLSARLREPGLEYKATLESEMLAALCGGVTSLVCPPDTDPVLDEPGLVEMLKQRAHTLSHAHVYPLGALTLGLKGEILTEMAELTEAGCIGFSQAEEPIVDTNVLLRALQYAQTFGYTTWLRAQDAHLGRGGVAHGGALATRLGLAGVPVIAETVAIHTILELVRATGARVHICRISSAAGIELIRRARADGIAVTCDVGVHHVHLTDLDIGFFDAQCRLTPPLRSARDRDAIRSGLLDGTIDAICSDHTPVDDDAKQLPFAEAESGATGLEVLLALTLKWAREEGLLLVDALARVTSVPAGLCNQPCGRIEVGLPADLCLFDPDLLWRVEARELKSQGKNSPFLGYELQGRTVMTFVEGNLVYDLRGDHARRDPASGSN